MHVDCQTCPVRERMCGDCMVTHLFSLAPPVPAIEPAEQAALDMFVANGLVNVADLASVQVNVEAAGLRSTG